MHLRCRTWLLLFAVVGVALAVYFEPTHCVRGWLWGEAFFDGRPTSWWRGVIESDLQIDPHLLWIPEDEDSPPAGMAQRFQDCVAGRLQTGLSSHLAESRQAERVLIDLMADDNEKIAGFAKDLLETIRRMPNNTRANHPPRYWWVRAITRHNMTHFGLEMAHFELAD